jgi:hypothetical protein
MGSTQPPIQWEPRERVGLFPRISSGRGLKLTTHRNRLPDSHLTLNGRNIPFVNNVQYLGVLFDKRMTWRLHIQMIEAKAFRTFIRIYSLFRSERLSANIKLTLHKALIRQNVTYWNCRDCKIRFSAPSAIFRGAHRFAMLSSHPKSWKWKYSLHWTRRGPTQKI